MNIWPGGYRHAMNQSNHSSWNYSHYPGTLQTCTECGNPTDRCEEDSLYIGEDCEIGPLCEECYRNAKSSLDSFV